MYNSLQLHIFYHLCRYEIVCATTVHYDLAYPVFGFASSPKQTVSLGWVLWLPSRELSSSSKIFRPQHPLPQHFILELWKCEFHHHLLSYLDTHRIYVRYFHRQSIYFTASASSSSSSSRKSISIIILPSL
jgi:hypothetical protein